MTNHARSSRREFLKRSIVGGMAATAGFSIHSAATAAPKGRIPKSSRVALTTGEDHVDNIFQALKPFSEQISQAIGDRRVIVKPNNVSTTVQLCATHADSIHGILEFLKSIGKTNYAIAESAASAPSMEGFDNYGYIPLAEKYSADLLDLDKEGHEILYLIDENDFHPHAIRLSKVLLDEDNYIISAAVMKTHDRVVATLSLKNIVVGAPIKDEGFRWGRGSKEGSRNDKPIVHGGGTKGINYNLYDLAPRLHPDLSVIDGYQGMEGNGPVGGTPVEHRVAVASTDWLAADRVAVELMGIDFADIGYLNYCSQAGMGQADLSKIEVLGPSVKDHIKKYKLSNRIERQMGWKKSA